MNGSEIWIWLVVGIVPYYVTWQRVRNGRILKVRALFWSLEVLLGQGGRYQLTMHVPLINRLQSAIWAAIMHLRADEPPQK